ncbi:MAG TPA: MFS transporter [Steroidobacteraceae bacterium]|nr:MFS transporter [Steroidobacteraceae bacterium]
MSDQSKSLLARFLGRSANIDPKEMPAVIAAFVLFFFIFAGYFAVRPVRETAGTLLGRERVAHLFLVTWVASIAIVPIYGWLVARVRRSVLLPFIYGFIALALAVVGLVLKSYPENVRSMQFFYVMISVLNLFMVSVFWSFLLELFNKEQAKRLFGVIAAGGTAGALVGPALTTLLVKQIGNPGVLFMGAAMFVVTILCQRTLINIWRGSGSGTAGSGRDDRPLGGNPFAGFTALVKSPYLLGISCFIVLLATATTFLYFEQLRIVSDTFHDKETRTRVFSIIDTVVQTLTVVFQLFLTGRIAQRVGVIALVTFVPVLMVLGFIGLALTGTFAVLVTVMVLRRVGEYAFIRPGREMLFSTVDNETRYKVKNLIDVTIYRGGDAVSSQVQDALGNAGWTPAFIAALGAVLAAVWALVGVYLGRMYNKDRSAVAQAQPVAGHT